MGSIAAAGQVAFVSTQLDTERQAITADSSMDKPFPASHLTLHRSQASLTSCQLSRPPTHFSGPGGSLLKITKLAFSIFVALSITVP